MKLKTKTPEEAQSEANMRQAIMIAMKANNVPVTGEVWFSLVFASRTALEQIASELHVSQTF